ncbi:MAG: tetratricopeptide repeat protein, partial [Cyanobacteria bacterium J06632_3]
MDAAEATVDPASASILWEQEHKGRQLYQSEQFAEAITLWQEIADTYEQRQDKLAQASALSNLALSYQKLGDWASAQTTISESLQLLTTQPSSDMRSRVMAQTRVAQGSLQLSMGSPEAALETWQQAEQAYAQVGDETGQLRSQINQAQALRELGFYSQSLNTLNDVMAAMETQPSSLLKGITLRRLGDMLRLTGELDKAEAVLVQSLEIVQLFHQPTEISATLLSLGHVAVKADEIQAAREWYAQASAQWTHANAQETGNSIQHSQINSSSQQTVAQTVTAGNDERAVVSAVHLVPIELSQLALAIDTQSWDTVGILGPKIQRQFSILPDSRMTVYHQVHWANSMIKLRHIVSDSRDAFEQIADVPNWLTVAQQLQKGAVQARRLGDIRAEAYAVGTLAEVYEQTQQWKIAETLAEKALRLSQSIGADEMTYRWQSHLGQIWQAPQNADRSVQKALGAYSQAVKTLSALRGDVAAASVNAQFSFEETVEPIYRKYVSLLLDAANSVEIALPNGELQRQHHLSEAQSVIESLRLAELDNYFKEACIDVQPVNINQLDDRAAVFYTIVLSDRIAVILQLPGQPLQQFSTLVSGADVARISAELRQQLVILSRRRYIPLAQQMYDWLIAPVRDAIADSEATTLVFVLDGPLQNVPMSVLHDGDHFLIEDYAVGLTPGVNLLNPKPWDAENLSVLAVGLTEGRQGLSPLPYV